MQRVRKVAKIVRLRLCRLEVSLLQSKLHVEKIVLLCVLFLAMPVLLMELWTDWSAPGCAVALLLVKGNMNDLGQSIARSLADYH